MKATKKTTLMLALLALIAMCFTFSANASSLDIYEDFEYTVISEKKKTCEIDEIHISTSDYLEIPSKMDGYTVVSLRDEVFQDIFYPEIKSIKIPGTIKEIPEWCFSGMKSLEKVILEEGLTKIGTRAFALTGITEIIIPSTVTSIEYEAFLSCEKLTKVSLPKNIKELEFSTFSGCKALKGIILPENLTSIESFLFDDCSSLESIEIPETVTFIDSFAFSGCSNLSSIKIPTSVKSIGDYAFSETNITKITIPGTTTCLGDKVFNRCKSLEYVYILPLIAFWIGILRTSMTSSAKD